MVLEPDGRAHFGDYYSLTEEQRKELYAGHHLLVIVGVVNYADIFDEKHETKFCYEYDYRADLLAACPHFNSAN